MGKYDDKISTLFVKYVKPMGLPPRLAGECKHAMEAAARKAKGNAKAIKAAIPTYLEERGYDAKGKKKAVKKARAGKTKSTKEEKTAPKTPAKNHPPVARVTKKDRAAADAPDPAREGAVKSAGKTVVQGDNERGVPKGNIDLSKLERKTLKAMASDVGATIDKDMSDDAVRSKIAEKLTGYDGTAKAKIKAGVEAGLKIDELDNCIGLFIDLSQAVCIACPAQSDCRKLFEEHRAGGFKVFEVAPKVVSADAVVAKTKETKETKETKAPKFDKEKAISIVPFKKVVKLPSVKMDGQDVDNMAHKSFLRDLKEKSPTTLGTFRNVVLAHYTHAPEDKNGKSLAMWMVNYCEKLSILKTA